MISSLNQRQDIGNGSSTDVEFTQKVHFASPAQTMILCMALLQNPRHNMVEDLLAISVLALCISSDSLGGHITYAHGYIQISCMEIWDIDVERECYNMGASRIEDFLLWAKMTLLSTFDCDTQTWRMAQKLRPNVPLAQIQLCHFDTCRQFFWTDSLTLSLQKKIIREQVLRRSKQAVKNR